MVSACKANTLIGFASPKRLEAEHHLVCEGGTPSSMPSLQAMSKQTLPTKSGVTAFTKPPPKGGFVIYM